VFAHEGALEIIPTADIDLVQFDADEVEALPLTHRLAGVRHRKYVISHPDQGTDLCAYEATFFGEFPLQGGGRGFSGGDAAPGRDPEISRPRVVGEGFEEQDAIVTIQDDGPDRLPNWDVHGMRTRVLHEQELSGHNPETSG
jgi:hypothetical protein